MNPPAGHDWYGYATQLGYLDVKELLAHADRPTAPELDEASMTKHFFYFKGQQRHAVWYDDPETLAAKYQAAVRHGARGVAMWTANFGDDAMWEALRKLK